jgi:hypothetical protein
MSTMKTIGFEDESTSMTLKRGTKERLRQLGEKDQSYDEVIRNLLDVSAKAYEEQRNEAKKRRG